MGAGQGKLARTVTKVDVDAQVTGVSLSVSQFLEGLGGAVLLLKNDGLILHANKGFHKLLHLDSKEAQGRYLTDYIHGIFASKEGKRVYVGTQFPVSVLVSASCQAHATVKDTGQEITVCILVTSFSLERLSRWTAEAEQPESEDSMRPDLEAEEEEADEESAIYVALLSDAADDVKERQRMKSRLAESEMRRKAVVDTSKDALVLANGQGTIMMFSSAACRLFGYSAPSEVLGRNLKALMPPEVAANHDQYLHSYLTTGVPKVIGLGREVDAMRKDGMIIPVRLSMTETTPVNGQRYFLGILHDRTLEKKFQRLLNEQKHWIEEVISDPEADHIMVIGEDGQIYLRNPDGNLMHPEAADDDNDCGSPTPDRGVVRFSIDPRSQ